MNLQLYRDHLKARGEKYIHEISFSLYFSYYCTIPEPESMDILWFFEQMKNRDLVFRRVGVWG